MNFNHEIAVGDDGSSRSYYRKIKKRYFNDKILMEQTTKNTRIENQTMILNSTMGEQVSNQLKILSPRECTNLIKSVSDREPLYSGSSQIFVHKLMTNMTIKNLGKKSAELTIRHINPRFDLNSRMPWGNPIEAWLLGLQDESLNAVHYVPSEKLVGATPYVSNIFNKTYNVKQEVRFRLSPGKSHIHSTEIYINENIYSEILEFNDTAVSKLTHYQMLTANGTPFASPESSKGGEIVTSAKVKLMVTSNSLVHYYWTSDFNHSYILTDLFPKGLP